MKPTKDSLVLYKQSPALVVEVGDKLEILLPAGKSRSVREKDVIPLHPGPVRGYPDLEEDAVEGQPEEAWELLQGEEPSLKDLAELVYGEWTPSTAWAAYKLLNRTPWFGGTPGAIEVVPPEEAEARIRADREKAEAENRWEDFLQRFQSGRADPVEDEPFIRDLEIFALGNSKGSRILKALGKSQTPQNAHRELVKRGIKPDTWNPYPLRLGLPLTIPHHEVPDLPDEERLDLTGTPAYAIDDEGNRDPDDAVSWDGTRFWIHVADVAALVHPDSDLDRSARERASSLYLPEGTVPMLPPEVVECTGLGLGEISPALSYSFVPDVDGGLSDFRIEKTQVKVTRLTYGEAESRIDEEPLVSMRRHADAFRTARGSRGSVSIHLPEVKITVESGEPLITPLPELASRDTVTEAMLMAGAGAAAYCDERNIPIPHAVQPAPEIDDEILSISENDLAGQYGLRRYMKRSRTTVESEPHAGLGLEAYSRVTSPIRRYPDLLASQQIRAFLSGSEILDAEQTLIALAAYETRAGSLVQAERASNLHWKLVYLSRRPNWHDEAVLVDRRERQGIFLIPNMALETRVPLKGDMAPGTRVLLTLKEVDIPEASAVFRVEEVLS